MLSRSSYQSVTQLKKVRDNVNLFDVLIFISLIILVCLLGIQAMSKYQHGSGQKLFLQLF